MEDNIIVVLEGMPGAGKSSFLSKIQEDNLKDIVIFPQIYLGKDEVKGKNPDDYYLQEELRRSRDIRQIKGKMVFIDRGIYSHLAYAHAKSVLEPKESKRFAKMEKLFKSKIRKYLYSPSYVFFIDIKEAISIERRKKNERNLNFREWYDVRFLRQLRKSYKYIFKQNKITPLIIDTSNLTKEEVYIRLLPATNIQKKLLKKQ